MFLSDARGENQSVLESTLECGQRFIIQAIPVWPWDFVISVSVYLSVCLQPMSSEGLEQCRQSVQISDLAEHYQLGAVQDSALCRL